MYRSNKTRSSSNTTSGLSYSAAPAQARFYCTFRFWCVFMPALLISIWIYLILENPGCPDYEIE